MDIDDTIAEFVVQKAPTELIEALNVLDGLDLPVHDHRSFEQQLSEIGTNDDDDTRRVTERLINRFTARDFPILSTQNAFEKYWEISQPTLGPIPEFDIPGIGLDPIPEIPPICDLYRDIWRRHGLRGVWAADCACRGYTRAARTTSDEHAIAIGYYDGKRFIETGRCDVPTR
jgi:hypothetical protein